MQIIEHQFTVKAGRGAFRKARKKASALLKTHGVRNCLTVDVVSKKGWIIGHCMMYVCKETDHEEIEGRLYLSIFQFGKFKKKVILSDYWNS